MHIWMGTNIEELSYYKFKKNYEMVHLQLYSYYHEHKLASFQLDLVAFDTIIIHT